MKLRASAIDSSFRATGAVPATPRWRPRVIFHDAIGSGRSPASAICWAGKGGPRRRRSLRREPRDAVPVGRRRIFAQRLALPEQAPRRPVVRVVLDQRREARDRVVEAPRAVRGESAHELVLEPPEAAVAVVGPP